MALRRHGAPVIAHTPKKNSANVNPKTSLPIRKRPEPAHPIRDFDRFVTFFPVDEGFDSQQFLKKWLIPYMNMSFSYGRWNIVAHPTTRETLGKMQVVGLTIFFKERNKRLQNCRKISLSGDKAKWGQKILSFAITNSIVDDGN